MGSKSDNDEKQAVEELLCEAMDMVILEEAAAAINSSLPRDLETRFQLLKKTFHSSTTQKPASFPTQTRNYLPHSSQQQTMKKLRQYEKNPKNTSPKWFGCWRRESREERERNYMRKMVEKARKEEERICGEAEKVIKWVNYASAQMEPYIHA